MGEGSAVRVLKVDPTRPDPDLFLGAVQILGDGGIVAYPTETFYGLGADFSNPEALEKLFRLKKRDASHPVSIVIHNREALTGIVSEIPEAAEPLMNAFWPGPLTLIFPCSSQVPVRLTAGTGKIGTRIPSHPVALQLLESFSRPVTATSANLSGEEELRTAEDVRAALGTGVDLIIDGGDTPGGKPSTVVDLGYRPPRLVRDGWIPFSRVMETLGFAATETHDW